MIVRSMSCVGLVIAMGALAFGETYEGFTLPYQTVQIAASQTGTIDSLLVREGDTVQPNQLLATLDTSVLLASLRVAEVRASRMGAIAAATASLEAQRRRLEKLQSLHLSGHASQEEIEIARTEAEIAGAKLTAATEDKLLSEAETEQIKVQIENRSIRSPVDGVVTELHRSVGETVSSSVDNAIVTIVQVSRLRARLYLPTHVAEGLSVHQKMPLRISDEKKPALGIIEFISPVTDSDSDTVRIELVIDNEKGIYRSGLRCELLIDEDPLSGGTVTPIKP